MKMKNVFFSTRRAVAFAWGRCWSWRKHLISKAIKDEALGYLETNQARLLFVMGTGRSGTQLISDLLNASEKAVVFHEPNFREDVSTMDVLRRDHQQTLRYWREFRGVEIFKRWMKEPEGMLYGEVNGTIRYQAQAIRELFPKARMLLLSRDPRGVIRSVMGWKQFYGPGSKGAFALAPLSGDSFEAEWGDMSRFERICWGWQNTNQMLMKVIPPSHWLMLEKCTTDYEYFDRHFSQNVGIQITRQVWQQHVSQKSRNATKEYGFPAYDMWTEEQKQSFMRICGPTMQKLGYQVD
jgi:hypothetical protein